MTGMAPQHEAAMQAAVARIERLQTAYQRVFGSGRGAATKEDKQLVMADLESVCSARRNQLRESEHATIYEMGKFSVWQRINNMRFPRPADAKAEFRVSVKRSGGLSNEDHEEDRRVEKAGRGVAEATDD